MKLLVTTATAALLGAGMAFAAGGMADIDTDADGAVSLEEAQTYDPSVTADAFAEFDANADSSLDDVEFAAWEAEMSSASGQGDADLGLDTDTGADVGADADADLGVDTDIEDSGVDLDTDAGLDTDVNADLGIE